MEARSRFTSSFGLTTSNHIIMLQQLLHTIFKPDRKRISAVITDIEIFYTYMHKNKQLEDDIYLIYIYSNNYWSYLHSYSWLSHEQENYLHQGILNFILFHCYQYLDNKEDQFYKSTHKILNSLYSFSPQNEKTRKLQSMVIEALIMVKRKKQGNFNIENNSVIFKYITWTLQNTILNMD